MFKNNKNIVLAGIGIIIIAVITIAMIFIRNKPKNMVIKMYEKIKQNDNYTFSMEGENKESTYKVSMLQKGNDASIDVYSEDEHITTLILGNNVYYLSHNDKEYILSSEDDEVNSDEILVDELKEITKMIYSTGREKINGKEYYYEEYETDGSTFSIYADMNEDSVIKTRFYFDGEELVYIKNIVTTEPVEEDEPTEAEEDEDIETDEDTEEENTEINIEPVQEELLKASLKFEVDESLFEVPKEYKKVEN